MIGFGFSVFTQAILGLGGGFRGSALNLDFTSGSRTLDPRVTFSRTTNATLTNSAGLVTYAPHNLLTYSEQFDNAAWSKGNITVNANSTAAPDGATTADTLNEGTSTNYHNLTGALVAAGTYTVSLFAKNINAQYLVLTLTRSAGEYCSVVYDTAGGTVANSTAAGPGFSVSSTSIVSGGDGWYRCVMTCVIPNSANFNISLSNSTTTGSFGLSSYTGTSRQMSVWGAQVELGSTATTYNPTTVKNLLGYTEHFDNAAWTKSNASISATKVDDIYGQPFAQKLVENTANSTHVAFQSASVVAGTVYTFTAYLKAAEETTATLSISVSPFPRVKFDLAAGTIISSQGGGTGTIAAVGNGWYRCSMTCASPTTNGACLIAIRDIDNNFTGDGTSGIYIFGAQLSDSASVDPYVYNPVAAPSSVAYYGPRFDYDPVTLAPKGLLIEEQRTNLLTYSQAIGSWSKTGSSVTANTVAAPDGTTTADKLVEDTSTGSHSVSNAGSSVVAGTTYTYSCYVKAAGRTQVRILLANNFSPNPNAVFDLTSVTVVSSANTTSTPTITSVGDGWYRCVIAGTATTTGTGTALIYSAVAGSSSYTGDGTSGIYLWGAQLEAGAFATSYIPTVASQVTRAADSASMIGNNFARWYNATQGTLFAQFDTPASGNRPVLSVGDGTANNMIQLRTEATDPYFRVTTGGVAQAGLDVGTVAANTTYKMTGAYEANNFSACINAGVVGSDTSGTVSVVTRMLLGSDQAGSYLNGHISRAAAYGRVLAATEQQGVTA